MTIPINMSQLLPGSGGALGSLADPSPELQIPNPDDDYIDGDDVQMEQHVPQHPTAK